MAFRLFCSFPLSVALLLLLFCCWTTSVNGSGTVCNGKTFLDGTWVRKSPLPSEVDGENFIVCSTEGKIHHPLCVANPSMPRVEHHSYMCRDQFYEKHPKTDVVYEVSKHSPANFEWIPNTCVLETWNEKTFCDILGNRHILLMGDSTMAQTFGTLENMIYQGKHATSEERLKCLRHLHFQISDFMTFSAHEDRGMGVYQAVKKHGGNNLDYVFFQTGPHWHTKIDRMRQYYNVTVNDERFMDYFFPKLAEEIEGVVRRFKNVKFVYKTENPPHFGCQPDLKIRNDITRAVSKAKTGKQKYGWENLHLIEDKFIPFAIKYNATVFRMDPLFPREESHPHGDCLHYCLPGPINVFSRMLQHFLVHGEANWRSSEVYPDKLPFDLTIDW